MEFAISDVDLIVKQLIHDLSPGQVSDQIPGLPAHLLFMCVRYCDHVNDDEKLQTLLTSSISAIGIITKVKQHCKWYMNVDILKSTDVFLYL
jgi:myosin-5